MEPSRALHHHPQLERTECLHQENIAGKPGPGILSKQQGHVSDHHFSGDHPYGAESWDWIVKLYWNLFSIRYTSFHETATADAVLGYLIAFLVLLSTIKLWHLLRLNPKLHLITSTLQRAWTDISGFLLVMTIMLLAYSIAVGYPRTISMQPPASSVMVWYHRSIQLMLLCKSDC